MEYNIVGWFEIPVLDMGRAKKFYETVFDVNLHQEDFDGVLMAWFPFAEGKPGAPGSLILHKDSYQPDAHKGVLLYFSSQNVSNELGKIEEAGGTILQGKTLISEEIGYMATFLDSEGNRIALHSRA
ncbi:VOC family protein [Ascidiimonas aurantiaca]|uniref:VOC family protein n=1 Tax=Ascidiimonas aurantiaca TaxID=1685432 RepID=UPI0030EF1872